MASHSTDSFSDSKSCPSHTFLAKNAASQAGLPLGQDLYTYTWATAALAMLNHQVSSFFLLVFHGKLWFRFFPPSSFFLLHRSGVQDSRPSVAKCLHFSAQLWSNWKIGLWDMKQKLKLSETDPLQVPFSRKPGLPRPMYIVVGVI